MSIPVAQLDQLAQWDLNESTVNDFFVAVYRMCEETVTRSK